MKLRLVSFACVALAVFLGSSPSISKTRFAGGLDAAKIRAGDFTAEAPPVAGENSIVHFDTLAQFKARSALPSGLTYVHVRAVAGSYPPPPGIDATPLWFKPAPAATGIWGEIKVAGQIFDPVYSTNPVNVGEFGLISDGFYGLGNGCVFSATTKGGNVLAVSSTAGCGVGHRLTTINWATRAAASLPIVPPGTKITAIGAGAITVSKPVPAMTSVPTAAWADNMSGTDNSAAIQAALNFAMENHLVDVKFPNGQFLFGTSLNAGWGDTYRTLNIQGGYRGAFANNPGTRLLFAQINQPAINFEGALKSGIRGVSIIGRNFNYLTFGQGQPSFSPNKADWLPPEFSPSSGPGGFATNAPFAGVTEDAYCGPAPRIGYPDLAFPSWTGLTTQYGRAVGSSDVKLEDIEIDGFGVAYVNGLTCALNGDFTKIVNFTGAKNAYDIAVVQTQSRNVELRNLNFEHFHAALTNSDFGLGGGTFNGPMANMSFADGYEMFRFGHMGYAEPVTIDNSYSENIVRIGDFTGNGAFTNSVVFHGGTLNVHEGLHGQIPASYISNNGPVTFSGVTFTGNQRIGTWMNGGGGVKFVDGGSWQCATAPPTTIAQLRAVNYSGGCLLGYGASNIQDPIAATHYSALNASPNAAPLSSVMTSYAPARVPMTQGLTQFRDQGKRLRNLTIPDGQLIDPANEGQVGTAPSISNDVLTFGNCWQSQSAFPLAPGVILLHNATGTAFVVTSVGDPTPNPKCYPATSVMVTAQQQNNLNVVPGTNRFLSNNITAAALTGYLSRINGPLIELPTHLYFGAFTSGSTIISNVNDGTGSAASLTNYLSVGDIFSDAGASSGYGAYTTLGANPLAWPIPAGGVTLSAVTNGNPGSIVISAPAQSTGTFPIFPFELRP
jgi:hypothetical protein